MKAVGVLAARAPDLATAVTAASAKAFVFLGGTPLPIDRIAADRPFRSGKHKRHGMNVQVIADLHGKLLWASPALPGAVHDIRAARARGVIDALTEAGPACWADKSYQGAGRTVRVPFRGRWERFSTGRRAVNTTHIRIRDPGSDHELVVFGVGSGSGRGAAGVGRPVPGAAWWRGRGRSACRRRAARRGRRRRAARRGRAPGTSPRSRPGARPGADVGRSPSAGSCSASAGAGLTAVRIDGRGDVTQGRRAAGGRARGACTRPAGCGRRRCGARSSRGQRPDSRRRCVPRRWLR